MFDRIVKFALRIHRVVAGSESWYAAWQAIKGEIYPYLPQILGYLAAGGTMIATLSQDISWIGIIVLTFAAFIAVRQWAIQRRSDAYHPETKESGTIPLESDQSRNALYVGSIHAYRTGEDPTVLGIVITGFNATGRTIDIDVVGGRIRAKLNSPEAPQQDFGALPPLRMATELVSHRNVGHLSEFRLLLEQRMPDAMADAVNSLSDREAVTLKFSDLDVQATSKSSHTWTLKVPLWDGLTLRRPFDAIVASRAHILKAEGISIGVNRG